MRACSTGVFGSCLLLCASMTHAIRHSGAKNCALCLDGEHESSLFRSMSRGQPTKAVAKARAAGETALTVDCRSGIRLERLFHPSYISKSPDDARHTEGRE